MQGRLRAAFVTHLSPLLAILTIQTRLLVVCGQVPDCVVKDRSKQCLVGHPVRVTLPDIEYEREIAILLTLSGRELQGSVDSNTRSILGR